MPASHDDLPTNQCCPETDVETPMATVARNVPPSGLDAPGRLRGAPAGPRQPRRTGRHQRAAMGRPHGSLSAWDGCTGGTETTQSPPDDASELAAPSHEVAGNAEWPPAAWRRTCVLLSCLAGLGISAYLTISHFADIPLACSDTGLVNCQQVTHSAQSYVLGVPVAVLGLGFFAVMAVLGLPWAWRAAVWRLHLARLVLAVVGMGFVLYLVSAELLIIGHICLYCTAVHVITFALFVLIVSNAPPVPSIGGEQPSGKEATRKSRT